MAANEKIHKGQIRDHTRARVGSPPIHVHNLIKKMPQGVQRDKALINAVIDNPEFYNVAEKSGQRALQTRVGRQVSRAGVALDAALGEAKRLLGKESSASPEQGRNLEEQ